MQLARTVVLIGLMGAGKTSVGQALARKLGAVFRDSDAEVEAAAQFTIPEIFEKYGETAFRDGERRVIARLLDLAPHVLATGGGAFMNDQTRALLKGRAVTVWLRADLDVLVERTSGRSHRPLLNQGDPREILGDLMAKRYPIYAQADVAVESYANQPHDRMVGRILSALRAHEAKTGEPILTGETA